MLNYLKFAGGKYINHSARGQIHRAISQHYWDENNTQLEVIFKKEKEEENCNEFWKIVPEQLYMNVPKFYSSCLLHIYMWIILLEN